MGKIILLVIVVAIAAVVVVAGKYVTHMVHTNDFSSKSQDFPPALRRAASAGVVNDGTIRDIVKGWAQEVKLPLRDADIEVFADPVVVSGSGGDCKIVETPATYSKLIIADVGAVKNLGIRCARLTIVGFKATFQRPGGSRVSVERYSYANDYGG